MSVAGRGIGRPSESYPPERRSLRYAAWPEAERSAFEQARKENGPFDAVNPATTWAAATVRRRVMVVGRFLGWLARNGQLRHDEVPPDRMTPERLEGFIVEARTLVSAHSLSQFLRDLRQYYQALAPDRDWRWLTRNALAPSARAVRESKKPKRTFDARDMLCRALSLMDQIDPSTADTAAMLDYRDALMVALECLLPLRLGTLGRMELGTNLLVKDNSIRLMFEEEEVKNRVPVFMAMPLFMHPYVRTYLGRVRATLLRGHAENVAVWISKRGRPIRINALPHAFDRIGRKLIGRPIGCHDFRYSVATTILTDDPRATRLAAGLLAHVSTRSVNEHYDYSRDEGVRAVWAQLRRKYQAS